jgi:amino acid transporter
MDLCTPAIVYLTIAVLTLVYMFYQRASLESMILKILFGAAWVWILNFLCSKGLETVSWILVILPYVLTGFLLSLILGLIQTGTVTSHNPLITSLPTTLPRQYRR